MQHRSPALASLTNISALVNVMTESSTTVELTSSACTLLCRLLVTETTRYDDTDHDDDKRNDHGIKPYIVPIALVNKAIVHFFPQINNTGEAGMNGDGGGKIDLTVLCSRA
uniref:Uncharacterized protein n=1 Tax=Lygus hesperus TaxID=30085 RepID=A0A0A9WCA3_LYGHE